MPALGTPSDWVLVLFFLAAVATAGLSLAAWQRRRAPGALSLSLAASVVTLWYGLAALEITSRTPAVKLLLVNQEAICQALLPVLWLLLVLELTGRRPWLRRAEPGLFVIPAVTVALAFTNSWLLRGGAFGAGLPLTAGPWFWTQTAYSGLLLALSLLALGRAWLRAAAPARGQLGLLLACLLLPATGLAVGALSPAGGAPALLALGSVVVVWGWFSFGLFDLRPLAQAAIVAGLREAVVVIDSDGRLADFNPAAAALLGWTDLAPRRGQPAAAALAGWPALADIVSAALAAGAADPPAELAQGLGAERRVFELSLTPLTDAHGRTLGRVLWLRDATEHHRIEDELARLASTDELTGLADHRRVFEALRDEVGRARRYAASLALLRIELDQFPALNDQVGRAAGDEAWRALARALARLARQSDLAARASRDEFVLILPHTNLLGAETVAGRLVAAVSQMEAGGRPLRLSVGAAELAPDDDDQGTALLARAAQALRAAQAAGGGRVEIALT